MRAVRMTVGGVPGGEQPTWAYPAGQSLGTFLVPIYKCAVEGTDGAGRPQRTVFDVLRFGVMSQDGKTARVVGLADRQTHIIKAWIPTYRVHSASSTENGAWQVYDNFLIHDGPDHAKELFATIGCIEIMGPGGFVRFNELLIALAGPKAADKQKQLLEIGRSGLLSITYDAAARPTLKPAT